MELTKKEIKEWLLDNCVNKNGNLYLSGLDFSDFDGNVIINSMKVKGDLSHSFHEVGGNLFQDEQKVEGNLWQDGQKVEGNLWQDGQKVKGELIR